MGTGESYIMINYPNGHKPKQNKTSLKQAKKSKYGRSIKYVADFVYSRNGLTVVEDAKGVRTPVYRLKKRMMAEKYGIQIREV